ncbi:MAG: ABC transporter substrate-binding protein [Candidatus Binatia bacterium]
MIPLSHLTRSFILVVFSLGGLIATFLPGVSFAEEGRIVILLSQDEAAYQDIQAGFRAYLHQQGVAAQFEEYQLQNSAIKAIQALDDAKQKGVHLLFTLGTAATQPALKEAGEIPVVAALGASAEELRNAANATGVVLDFPVQTQFQWMQKLLPAAKNIGILYNAHKTGDKVEDAKHTARTLGFTVTAQEVKTTQELTRALDKLANEARVLWGITDHTIYSPQTAESILLFSFRNRIPFAGLSLAWVKAGALYALDRDYRDLGIQCGELAVQMLRGAKAKTLPPVAPRKVVYALNLKTAQHMKLDIAQALIDGAQQVIQ